MGVDATMVRQACEGVTRRFDRKYMVGCCRERRFPHEMYKAMAEVGILGLGVPEEYGGMGGGVAEMVTALEELALKGLVPGFWLLTGLVRHAILKHGTEEQIRKFVLPTITGDLRMCLALTEPNAGTNTFKITTMAKKTDRGTYLLNGQKVFISAFKDSEIALVVTRTTAHRDVGKRTDGMSMFIVDPKSPGIEATPLNIGFASVEDQYQVFFTDVEVPEENLLGEEGKGFKYLFDALNPERILVAAQSIGLGEWILAKGVEYANIRAPFDAPIGSYQSVQHPMAYAKAHLEAARQVVYRAAEICDQGGTSGNLANMAKLLAGDAFFEAANATIQAHGGYGFDHDYDVLDTLIIARLGQVAPVNNNMLLNQIAEHVLKLPKSY